MVQLAVDKTPAVKDKRISRNLFDILIDSHRKEVDFMVRKVFTIVDCAILDAVQKKAIKSLIEEAVLRFSGAEDDLIRVNTMFLAKALKEKCDWMDFEKVSNDYNPLIG